MFEELENEVDLKAHEQQWIELQAMVDQTERDVELASIDVTVTQKLKTYKFMPCITQRVSVTAHVRIKLTNTPFVSCACN
jgi:hypothetical protein